jgi:PEP-CTERM motif
MDATAQGPTWDATAAWIRNPGLARKSRSPLFETSGEIMKFKQIALVAALSAALAPAFAAVNNLNTDAAELYIVVFNDDVGSYTLDLGVTLGEFKAGAVTAGYTFSRTVGSAFPDFGANPVSWGLQADSVDGAFSGSEAAMLTTTIGGGAPSSNFVNWEQSVFVMGQFAQQINVLGSHFTQANGDQFSAKGEAGHYTEQVYIGSLGFGIGNAAGASSPLYLLSGAADNATLLSQKFVGTAVFEGRTFTYTSNIVSPPIPEPGTYALMLAGLAGVVGFARRRSRRD